MLYMPKRVLYNLHISLSGNCSSLMLEMTWNLERLRYATFLIKSPYIIRSNSIHRWQHKTPKCVNGRSSPDLFRPVYHKNRACWIAHRGIAIGQSKSKSVSDKVIAEMSIPKPGDFVDFTGDLERSRTTPNEKSLLKSFRARPELSASGRSLPMHQTESMPLKNKSADHFINQCVHIYKYTRETFS